MDISMDPAAEVAGLRRELALAREEIAALKGLAVIEGAERRRLQRLLTEATYGAAARKENPGTSARAIDKA